MSTNQGETPVLDLLAEMTAASIERSDLDPKTLMLVRLAALVAVDAPPVSYLMNLGVGGQVGVEAGDVQQVMIGIAPVVGGPRNRLRRGEHRARARPGDRRVRPRRQRSRHHLNRPN